MSTQQQSQAYKSGIHPVWCPGCGDFGVLSALYAALAQKMWDPKDIVLVSGIGCSSRLPGYVNTYGFHTVHGRTLPIALGVKLANPSLNVIAMGGDGDGFGIGGGHIPHMARRNPQVTYIVMDNSIYGLTKGQVSPTSLFGQKTGSTPYGNLETPLNPIALAVAYDISFVARGYSGRPKQLTELMVRAFDHKGFAFIDVISPCIVFNNTYKEIPPKIAEIDPSHNVTDRAKAFELAIDTSKIHLGVFYESIRTTYEEAQQQVIDASVSGSQSRVEQILARYS